MPNNELSLVHPKVSLIIGKWQKETYEELPP
jgi:hypothetical protein